MDVFSDIQDDPSFSGASGAGGAGGASGIGGAKDIIIQPLSVVLADRKFNIISTPLIVTKEKLSDWLIKHLSLDLDSIYVVGWRESLDPSYISFSKMLDKIETNRNTLFIIEDLETFIGYIGEISLMSYNNNFFLVIVDVVIAPNIRSIVDRYWPEAYELWPSPLDVPIEVVYNRKTNLISGGQLRDYNAKYISWRKLDHSEYENFKAPDELYGYLNVYLDEKVPSLESVTKDIAVQRAPKFRDIIQSIMFHNKNRHFISMIPGERGMIGFESLYGKLDSLQIPIHIIRSSDPLRVKEDTIESINSSNAPLVVLSDFTLSADMTIKNIDYYHITKGGRKSDIISIMSMLKGHNYTGSYPRKFHVNNYITETPTSDMPIDSIEEQQFSTIFTHFMNFDKISRNSDFRVVFVENTLNVVLE